MAKQKLNFRFHNPNTAEATADYILKMFIEANKEKVEQAMQDAAEISNYEPSQESAQCPLERAAVQLP